MSNTCTTNISCTSSLNLNLKLLIKIKEKKQISNKKCHLVRVYIMKTNSLLESLSVVARPLAQNTKHITVAVEL